MTNPDPMLELPETGVFVERQLALCTPVDPQGWEADIDESITAQSLSTDDEFLVTLPCATAYIFFDCEDVTGGIYWSFTAGGTADLAPGTYSPQRKFTRRGAEIRLRERVTQIYIRNRTPGATGRIYFITGQ